MCIQHLYDHVFSMCGSKMVSTTTLYTCCINSYGFSDAQNGCHDKEKVSGNIVLSFTTQYSTIFPICNYITNRVGWLWLNICQGLWSPLLVSGLLWALKSEICLVTISLFESSNATYTRPKEEEENGLTAPQRSKKAEQHSTQKTQAACLRGVHTALPPFLLI